MNKNKHENSNKDKKRVISSKSSKSQTKVTTLVIALVAVVLGGILFVGAVSGWFSSKKVTLDTEYICTDNCDSEYLELDASGYDELIKAQKSFIVFVDQSGCTTADRLRQFVSDYAKEKGIKVYRMMFSEVKNSPLHDAVKYYPSVAVISKGKVIGALQADSDADASAYNDYAAFLTWIQDYLY